MNVIHTADVRSKYNVGLNLMDKELYIQMSGSIFNLCDNLDECLPPQDPLLCVLLATVRGLFVTAGM